MRLPRPRRTLLLPLSLLALAGACRVDLQAPEEEGYGVFAGTWDGERWEGIGYAVLRADTLHVVGHRPDPGAFYDEFVRFSIPFRGEGVYEVPASRGRLEQLVGGDAGHFPRAAGAVQITRYSAAVVRGSVRLVAQEHGLAWRFEDGRFEVPVYASFEAVPPGPRSRR